MAVNPNITVDEWVYDLLEKLRQGKNRSELYQKYIIKGLAAEGLITENQREVAKSET